MKTFQHILYTSLWYSQYENNRIMHSFKGFKPSLKRPDFISKSFSWGNTNEGYDYWLEISKFWVSLYS